MTRDVTSFSDGMYHFKETMKAFASAAILSCLLVVTCITGCKEENTVIPPVEESVITTITVSLTPTGTSTTLKFVWEDIDGVGGTAPNRIDTIRLDKSQVYIGEIMVENRSVTPVVNITTEIASLKDEHQFFFTVTNGIASITTIDRDSRNLPVGLEIGIIPGNIGLGTLTVALSHWELATAKDGTTPSDETDISVMFPVVVQ